MQIIAEIREAKARLPLKIEAKLCMISKGLYDLDCISSEQWPKTTRRAQGIRLFKHPFLQLL